MAASLTPLTLIRYAAGIALHPSAFPPLLQQIENLSPSDASSVIKEPIFLHSPNSLLAGLISFASNENGDLNWKRRAEQVLEALFRLLPKEDLNQYDKEGRSILHLAIRDQIAVYLIELLLERGANPDLQDSQGRTPLAYAALYSTAEVAQLLIDKGAELELTNKNGNPPSYYLQERVINRQHIPALRAVFGNQNQNQNQETGQYQYQYYNNGNAAMNNFYNQYYNEINRYGYNGGKRKTRRARVHKKARKPKRRTTRK